MTKKKGLLLCSAAVLTAALVFGAFFGWKSFQRSKAAKAAGIWNAQGQWGEALHNGGNPKNAERLATKIRQIQENYLTEDNQVFCAIIPDKGYYLQGQGAPAADYNALFATVESGLSGSGIEYIDLTNALSIEQYYATDSHWQQQRLQPVLDALGNAMNFTARIDSSALEQKPEPFAGAYKKYGAKAVDQLVYLNNNVIQTATVENFQHPEVTTVYDLPRLDSDVPYDMFLSGATPIVTITSPLSKTNRELVIFRDSFSSSLAPLLLETYHKVTLVDLRYMASALLPKQVEFTNQDVLFLYSTLVADQSSILR